MPSTHESAPGRLPGLERLVEMLRAARLPVGVTETMDAAQVMRHLSMTTPSSAQSRARLRSHLRPVLCKALVDQPLFDEVFNDWSHLPPEAPDPRGTDTPRDGTDRPRGTRLEDSDEGSTTRGLWRFTGRFWVAIALAIALGIWLWLLLEPKPKIERTLVEPAPAASAPAPAAVPVAPAASAQPGDSNGLIVYGYFPQLRFSYEVRPVWPLALLAPFLIAILPLLRWAMPTPRVSRKRGIGNVSLRDWPIGKRQRNLVFRIAPTVEGQLQRHVRGAVEHRQAYARRPLLDPRRTVEATIAKLGLPVARYRHARLRPAYLVLVKTERDDDIGILWALRLRALDMRVDIFRFGDGNESAPPRCIEVGGSGRRFGFDALPNPEPGQRLLVVAPTNALLDASGKPWAWVRAARLARWEQRAVFTPDEPRDWNLEHVRELEQASAADKGMFVLPFDDNALSAWSEWLVRDHLPTVVLSEPQRYPRLLHESETSFVNDAESSALGDSPRDIGRTVSQLVSQLQVYLGENGFYWLCACAIPPVIDRRLALLLGEQYFLRSGASEDHTSLYMARNWRLLVRLPWLRDESQFPQWLRLALLSRLAPTIQDELRDVVRGTLVRDPQSTSGMRLGFEAPGVDQPPDGDGKRLDQRHLLFVGFVRDNLSAEQLMLRVPGEWNRWLAEVMASPSWWQRIKAGWSRASLRDGVRGQGWSDLSLTTAFVTCLLGFLITLLLTAPPDGIRPNLRVWLYREAVHPVLATHRAEVTAVAYSHDGRRLLTASADGTARLWDATTGQTVGAAMRHSARINHAEFSNDGKLILTAGDDAKVRLWDAITAKSWGAALQHEAPVASAHFFPDNREIVSTDSQGAHRWSVATQTRLGSVGPGKNDVSDLGKLLKFDPLPPDSDALIDPTGTIALVFGQNGVHLWRLNNEKGLLPFVQVTAKQTNYAGFDQTGKRVVCALADGGFGVWNVETSSWEEVIEGKQAKGTSATTYATFNPVSSGWLSAGPGRDAQLHLGNSQTISLPHVAAVVHAAYSPDGQRVATASTEGTVHVWNAATGEAIGPVLKQDSAVTRIAFSPDGLKIAGVGTNDVVHEWSAEPAVPSVVVDQGDYIADAAFSPDGRTIATASSDRTAKLSDTETGEQRGRLAHKGSVTSVSFSPDGTRVVTTSGDETAQLWRVSDGKPIGDPMQHNGLVTSAAFSADGAVLATASWDSTARLWGGATGSRLQAPMQHRKEVNHVEFDPVGSTVLTASDDNTAGLWRGSAEQLSLDSASAVHHATFSRDGQRIVTSSARGAQIWDSKSGKPIGNPLLHEASVNMSMFSPDGSSVLTASDDNTARLWKASDGTPIGPPLKHGGSVAMAVFSPDASRIATVSSDGSARVWERSTGELLGVPVQSRGAATAVAWSPQGNRLLVATAVLAASGAPPVGGQSAIEQKDASAEASTRASGLSLRASQGNPSNQPRASDQAASASAPTGSRRSAPNHAFVFPIASPGSSARSYGLDDVGRLLAANSRWTASAIIALSVLSGLIASWGITRQRRRLAALRPQTTP